MKKRFTTMLVCLILVMSLVPLAPVLAADDFPGKLDAPENVAVTATIESGAIYSYSIGFSMPAAYQSLHDRWNALSANRNVSEMNLNLEYDYKYNESGNWHYDASWDKAQGALEEWPVSDFNENEVAYATPSVMKDVPNNESMLAGNTVYFRCRLAVTYYDSDLGSYVKAASTWSNTAAVGKNANAVEMKMDPPVLTKAVLKANVSTGAPYFEITNKATDTVKTIDNSGNTIYIQIQYRKNGGQWITVTGYNKLQELFDVIPENTSDNAIDIKAGTYEIRARYGHCTDTAIVDVWSDYSNIIKIDSPAFYKGASSWAVPELDKAAQYGFITDRIKDNMTGNITREEFAEISVKLYEVYTGIKAEAGNTSFTDTTNPEVLKAANLGLVLGIGQGKFGPQQLVTREQMSTILLRALKVLNPTTDFSTTGAAKFADDAAIASWAQSGVYYCSKVGIIKGIGNNSFGPKGNSTREAAVIVCTRAYELYKHDSTSQVPQINSSVTPAISSSNFTGKWLIISDASDNFEIQYLIELSQSGSQVTGLCGDYTVNSAVSGTVSANVLTAKLLDKKLAGYEASFIVTMAADGKVFNGTWSSSDHTWKITGTMV